MLNGPVVILLFINLKWSEYQISRPYRNPNRNYNKNDVNKKFKEPLVFFLFIKDKLDHMVIQSEMIYHIAY